MVNRMIKRIAGLTALLLLATAAANAKEFTVEMRNSGESGSMVFEPPFLQVAVGDTVRFVPVDQGHNSVSEFTPDGAKGWQGVRNEAVTATIDKEGIYIYRCEPHTFMGMVGVIQAGKAVNKKAAIEAARVLSEQIAVNKERLDKYLSLSN